jgi:hypothetical protein
VQLLLPHAAITITPHVSAHTSNSTASTKPAAQAGPAATITTMSLTMPNVSVQQVVSEAMACVDNEGDIQPSLQCM